MNGREGEVLAPRPVCGEVCGEAGLLSALQLGDVAVVDDDLDGAKPEGGDFLPHDLDPCRDFDFCGLSCHEEGEGWDGDCGKWYHGKYTSRK